MVTKLSLGEWHMIAGPRATELMLSPIGVCIYCARSQADGVILEDEHIVPDGIGGDLILPKASCRTCAEKINLWEQEVQKRYLGVTRDAAGVKSRKRRGRNAESRRRYRAVAASVPEGGDPREERGPQITDPSDLPRMILVETTKGPPELLGGKIPGNGICLATAWDMAHGPTECTVDFWARGGDFLRLLAKISHGFAVATLGVGGFSPFLTDIILMHDHKPDDLWKFIGQTSLQSGTFLHRIRVVPEVVAIPSEGGLEVSFKQVIVADLQLFANFSAPRYAVVVGTLKR